VHTHILGAACFRFSGCSHSFVHASRVVTSQRLFTQFISSRLRHDPYISRPPRPDASCVVFLCVMLWCNNRQPRRKTRKPVAFGRCLGSVKSRVMSSALHQRSLISPYHTAFPSNPLSPRCNNVDRQAPAPCFRLQKAKRISNSSRTPASWQKAGMVTHRPAQTAPEVQ